MMALIQNTFQDGPDFPTVLDNNDPLGHFRSRFYLQKGTIYMCGNSLGPASRDAEDCIIQLVEKWKKEGVKIWNADGSKYYLFSSHLAKLMATLVGAGRDELTLGGCTTTAIHQAVSTFYKPTKERYKILVDDINFPTDRYAVDSQVRLKGLDPDYAVKVVQTNGKHLNEDDFIEAMTDDVSLVLLPGVLYRSAQIVDMKKVSDAANKRGIIIGWDLCHAVGALDINLNGLDVDFAVWCTYKYLNGGPGSAACLYINRKHFQKLPGLTGWFGNRPETQFLLKQEFEHQQDARGWQIGTPTLFSMAALEGSLRMFNEAGISSVRKKSLHITGYLMYLTEKHLVQHGFRLGNPREDRFRGGHVCLEHEDAFRISMALKARGVVPDFREPNIIRLTPAALYTSYADVYKVVDVLLDIVKSKAFEAISHKRNYVV